MHEKKIRTILVLTKQHRDNNDMTDRGHRYQLYEKKSKYSTRRHQKERFSALLALYWASPVTGEINTQRPVTRSFDFFHLCLNTRLSKLSRHRWLETPRAHYDVTLIYQTYWFVVLQWRSPVVSLTKDQFYGDLFFCFWLAWITCWTITRVVGDPKRHDTDVTWLLWCI